MNSPRESMGAATVWMLSRMINQPSATRPRRFRPVAEPMEARALLSHVALTATVIDPAMTASPGRGPTDVIVVNGQTELQPDGVLRN
jgi:hypothetical protein